ncbi:DUF6531 domain-containing protein [Enteractinococcus helveticum]|uniref:Type IV secretion protein Rhs n=1 Tax=Enteractinococcus helveticum TaxID=1837282 RepID=A0A1B7M1D2_9MICC|nr:DUF6531 domain-containing protein [Enteractinococcus helveticum]OAV62403.1 hypothetical protein A6F49_06755 [Enteractinococcus helveticum]
MSGIGGNEPTGYNYAAADTLKAKASNLQGKLYGQQGPRSSAVWTAMQEFRGYYSEVFDRNAEVASDGRREVANALGQLAGWVVELKEAAEAEDQRREEARAWAERQRQREDNLLVGAWHEVTTWFGGGDDPQPPPAQDPPNFHSDVVQVKGREIDPPAGSSSTSSAAPADLRHFQTRTGELDDELATAVSQFQSALSDYEAGCNSAWGYLNGQPVLTAMNSWLEDNANDAQWAGLVAEAFEAAGGEGRITMADASIAAALANAGVDSHRDNLTIEPFSAVGSQPTTGFADDPVNTSTGNFLEPEYDLDFSTAASSLQFSRMYNSLDDRTGAFGYGWSSVLDVRLELDDEGARFIKADGRQITFPRAAEGWDRGVGENYWLSDTPPTRLTYVAGLPDRALTVTDNEGNWWAFSPAGLWLAAGSGPGTTVSIVRDETGQITRLAHERGRFIDVEYISDRVASVSASDGRRIEYLYDDQLRLTEVTSSSGTRTYRWNDAGLIDQVVAADGVVEVVNTYDAKGRVISQLTPYGRSVRFAYLRGQVTSVSTDDGTGANTWIADRKGRVVGIIDADGNRQSMAYDPHGNVVSSTERDGQVTVHAYDHRGRMIRTVTPDGADLTYGYDDHDRVTTVVTAAGGVVEYEYETVIDRNPSIIIDPLGGRSELTWDNGLLTRVVDPEGVTVSLDYNSFGELIAMTNANGDTARYVRDAAGRITQASSALGHTTQFTYSDTGLLTARQDPTGAIWRYEYGTGDRLTATIDPEGHRTEVTYSSHGEVETLTDPLGRVITQNFDEFGNLAGLTLPDGARWAYTHDALSRLRKITDPNGAAWTYNYDVTGEVTAAIDPTGVRTDITRSRSANVATIQNAFEQLTLHTDEYGRLIKTQQTDDDAAELISYDAAGRPVEFVDANGGLTKVQRDLAGRITAITTPEHRTVRYEYDACGRPSVAIDPTGARTTLTYDADSRVTARTSPSGETSTIQYDAAGRIISETIPGVGVASYRYDKLGRLTAVRDSRYGHRRFRYDAAGQLIEAINGLGGVTRYEYDALGRVVKVTDPAGGVTTFDHTHLGAVAVVTDPLKRTIKTTYDPAGRKVSQTDHDGNVTEFTYDDAGRESAVFTNGQLVSQIIRDTAQRTATITDGTYDEPVEHLLTYNRLGQLIARVTTRGASSEEARWEYDADGYRKAMTTQDGTRISYHRDQTGRVTRIKHGTFGEAFYDYDADGRIIQARAADQLQTWAYGDGFPVAHTHTSTEGVAVTHMGRDETGRITELTGEHGTTMYTYDDGQQLTSAVTDGAETTWSYDAAGRMTAHTTPAGTTSYVYDQASQLLMVKHPDGETTTFEYDGQGQRIHERSDRAETKYAWDARGWLRGIIEQTPHGTTETDLMVNAFGELTDVNDTRLHWDIAAGVPSLLEVDGTSVFTGPAGVTGVSTTWQKPTWRAARGTHYQDPWQTLAEVSAHPGVGLGTDGSLRIAGLEWMGARAYDPSSAGFLSQDPLAAPLGAAWAANPYSYAGNDPLHAIDPHGLAPITDEELQAYADGLQGPLATGFNAAVDWTKDNWESIVAVGVIVGGVALTMTGVGGPAGIALMAAGGAAIGGGVSVISQQASHPNGEIDWGQVGTDALIGGIGGGASGLAARGLTQAARVVRPDVLLNPNASTTARTTYAALRSSTTRGAISAGTGGATTNVANYHVYGGDNRTWQGYVQNGLVGFGTGAVGSYGTSRLSPVSSQMGNSVVSRPMFGSTAGPRSTGPYTWGHFAGDQIGDRLVGGATNAINEGLRDTGQDGGNLPRSFWQGVATGGSDPTVGLHAK